MDYYEKIAQALTDSPELIDQLMSAIGAAARTNDLKQNGEITAIFVKYCAFSIGQNIVLHLHDHDCSRSKQKLDDLLESMRNLILAIVEDGCNKLNLADPFAITSHNQRVTNEIIDDIQKESQHGQSK